MTRNKRNSGNKKCLLLPDPDRSALATFILFHQEPGFPFLKQYGAGKVPLQAVHDSTELDFETKKFLFKVAGFEYDGKG